MSVASEKAKAAFQQIWQENTLACSFGLQGCVSLPSHDKDQASAPFWCPGERVVLFAHVFFFSVFFLLVFIHKQTCFEASETTAVLLKIFAILCFIFDTRILKIQVYLGFHFFGLRSSFVPYHQTTAISDSQPTHRSEGEGCHMTFTHILMTLK